MGELSQMLRADANLKQAKAHTVQYRFASTCLRTGEFNPKRIRRMTALEQSIAVDDNSSSAPPVGYRICPERKTGSFSVLPHSCRARTGRISSCWVSMRVAEKHLSLAKLSRYRASESQAQPVGIDNHLSCRRRSTRRHDSPDPSPMYHRCCSSYFRTPTVDECELTQHLDTNGTDVLP